MKDDIKIGILSGRLCELIISLLCEIEFHSNEDINNVNFDTNYNRLIQVSNKNANQELNCIIIPRILRGVYTIRNKKRIAHFKLNIPIEIDHKYIKKSLNWVISQLLISYLDVTNDELSSFLQSVSFEEYSKIETFENGERLIYDDSLSLNDKILVVLYFEYDKGRISNLYLNNKVKAKKGYLTIYLKNLKNRNLIHKTNEGVKLTRLGYQKAVEIIKELN